MENIVYCDDTYWHLVMLIFSRMALPSHKEWLLIVPKFKFCGSLQWFLLYMFHEFGWYSRHELMMSMNNKTILLSLIFLGLSVIMKNGFWFKIIASDESYLYGISTHVIAKYAEVPVLWKYVMVSHSSCCKGWGDALVDVALGCEII